VLFKIRKEVGHQLRFRLLQLPGTVHRSLLTGKDAASKFLFDRLRQVAMGALITDGPQQGSLVALLHSGPRRRPRRNFTILRHAIDSANSAEKALFHA
jgi:hypothetical protein